MFAGFETLPSEANFVMVAMENDEAAARMVQGLVERGVIVRHLATFGMPDCVRISIGTEEENAFLLETLSRV